MLEGREWCARVGASICDLANLRVAAPTGLPESYIELLAFSDGGEGPLPVMPFNLWLDPVSVVIEGIRTGNHGQSEFDGFLIIGGNGGGEYVAFDLRGDLPWSVVTIDMVAGRESAEIIAPDFDSFVGMIGVEKSPS